MSEMWDRPFIGDEVCSDCGEGLLDCSCVDDEDLDSIDDGFPPVSPFRHPEISFEDLPF